MSLRPLVEWPTPLQEVKGRLQPTDSKEDAQPSAEQSSPMMSLVPPPGGQDSPQRLRDAGSVENVYGIYQRTGKTSHVKVEPPSWGFGPIQ